MILRTLVNAGVHFASGVALGALSVTSAAALAALMRQGQGQGRNGHGHDHADAAGHDDHPLRAAAQRACRWFGGR